MKQLPVIFRKWKQDGSIIALFPTIAFDRDYHCLSYEHIGQHGAADTDLSAYTVPATESEYKSLLSELKAIGYDNLKPVKRNHPSYRMKLVDSAWDCRS